MSILTPAELEVAYLRVCQSHAQLLAVCQRIRSCINDYVSIADVDALDAAIAKATAAQPSGVPK